VTTRGNPSSITQQPSLTGDPEAGPFLHDIEEKLAALRDIVPRVARAVAQVRAQIEILAGDPQVTDSQRRVAVDETRREALADLDQLQAGAQAIRQGAYHMIEEAAGREVPSPGSGSDVDLAATRDRVWAPVRARLDELTDPNAMWRTVEEMGMAAAQRADTATLRALHELLPIYLTERGWHEAGAEVNARLDRVEAQYMLPLPRAAALARASLEAGWPRVQAAFDQARAEIEGRSRPVDSLPGFAPNEQVPIR
jgi:hypothetical protein